MNVSQNELIIIILMLILVYIYSKYPIDIALKAVPVLLVVYGILYMCNLTGLEEEFQMLEDNVEYNQASCYVNGNRPFVIDSRGRKAFDGSTARCVIAGGPVSWKQPVWELPISDPENPAFYNQFPSESAHFYKKI
jgi:hypothetical protein